MPLRFFVAQQEAAFGLFALDHDVDGIARVQLRDAIVVDHLFERDTALALEAHIDHNFLVGELDHGAGHDIFIELLGGGFRCLLAIEAFKRGGKIGEVIHVTIAGVVGGGRLGSCVCGRRGFGGWGGFGRRSILLGRVGGFNRFEGFELSVQRVALGVSGIGGVGHGSSVSGGRAR